MNVIIIGLGQIGMSYDILLSKEQYIYTHAKAFSLNKNFNLVCSVDPEAYKRRIFKQYYNLPAYKNLELALLNHKVDIAVIATPTSSHYDILCKLLKLTSPKLILCEKPLSYDINKARRMVDLCSNKNVALYVNYMRRSEPGAINVKKRIERSIISWPVKGFVWYSKGFLHNGSHFFNLLEDWLGEMVGFNLIHGGISLHCGDAEPEVKVTFKKGEVIFISSKEENFSNFSIELCAQNGRLRYENGGRSINWTSVKKDKKLKNYKFLADRSNEIPSEFHRYQHHVTLQLNNLLSGKETFLCEGKHALFTLEAMQSILGERT